MMKTFTPKNAPITKKQIWDFIYEKEEKVWLCRPTDEEVKKPAYTADEIPDMYAQHFVDAHQDLLEEYVDASEEEFVEEREWMIDDFHQSILRALKRKELPL